MDSRGRLTLPAEALDELGIAKGGYVEIESRHGEVVIRAVAWKASKK